VSAARRGSEAKGVAAALLQTSLAIAGYFVAKGTLHALQAAPLLLVRSAGAAVLLFVVSAFWSRRREPMKIAKGDAWRVIGLGLLAVPLNQGLFYAGLSLSTASHAALLYGLTPALVLLIGAVRGTERLTRPRAIGVFAAFAGVVLVLQHRAAPAAPAIQTPSLFGAAAQSAGAHALLGDLLVLCAVTSWASYTALSRGLVDRLGPVRATSWTLGAGALAYLPVGAWLSRDVVWTAQPAEIWWAVLWLITMSSVVSYVAWYYALQRLDPSRVAVFSNLQPIGTVLIAAVELGQTLDLGFAAGTVLVIAGVLVAQLSGRRPIVVPVEAG
jgi:drug/metabolite transporter (DMT)-like permease